MSHSGSYDQWMREVLSELRLRAQPVQPFPPAGADSADLQRLPPAPRGRGAPGGRIGRFAAGMLFGSPADRTDAAADDPTDTSAAAVTARRMRQRIAGQHDRGTAAAQEIQSGGRTLRGNFFSAAGHNLKEHAAPDLGRPVVLFLSGSAGTAETQGTEIAESYQAMGASVLAMNYGGFGGSTGEPSEQGLLEDGQAMLRHLLEMGYRADQIVLHGYSMGGAIAGQLQAANEAAGLDLRGVMLDRPMLSATHGIKGHMPLPQRFEAGNRALGALAGGITRRTVGKMSARKALARTRGTLPTAISTDSTGEAGDNQIFNRWAAELRQTLQARDGDQRRVGGAGSAGTHEDHAAMIAANRDTMANLIQRTGDLSAPAHVPVPPVPGRAQAQSQMDLEQAVHGAMTLGATCHDRFRARFGGAPPGDAQGLSELNGLTGSLEAFLARIAQLDAEGAPLEDPRAVATLLAGLRADVAAAHRMLAAAGRRRPPSAALVGLACAACGERLEELEAAQALPLVDARRLGGLERALAEAAASLREALGGQPDPPDGPPATAVLAQADAALSAIRQRRRQSLPPRPPRAPILRRRSVAGQGGQSSAPAG